MSATIRASHHYDAPVEQVFALLTDPASLTRMYADLGDTDIAITSHDPRDGAPRLVITRLVTVDLPGFARRALTPTNTVVQTDDWAPAAADGSRTCRYSVEVKGVPSRIDGEVVLRPDGGGCRQQVAATVKVSIPLLGGRLEKFAAGSGERQIAEQARWIAARLGD